MGETSDGRHRTIVDHVLASVRATLPTLSRVLTSAWMNSFTDRRSGSGERAVVATIAPAAERRRTIASPMPLVPPVTRARLPANSVGSEAKLRLLGHQAISRRAIFSPAKVKA